MKHEHLWNYWPSAVAQAYNPSTLGGWGGWITWSRDPDHPGLHGETPSLLKIQKISWTQWRMPVIPATREAEAGELPEPRRQRLQWAEIAPLNCSLGNKSETPSPIKNKKKNNNNNNNNLTVMMLSLDHAYESISYKRDDTLIENIINIHLQDITSQIT